MRCHVQRGAPLVKGKKSGGWPGKRLWVQAGGAGRSRGGFCLPGQSGCNLEHAVRSAFPVSSASLLHEGLCKGEKGAGLGLGCWKGFWSCQQLCVLGVGALLGLHHALCLLSPQTCSCSRGGPAAGQRGLVRSSAFICWSCRGVARPGDCEAFPQGCQHQPLASWHISVAGDTQLQEPRRLWIWGDPARALLCILPTSLPCLVSFHHCNSHQNLFTSILSGSRAVPRARLQGIHFETKMLFFFLFLAFLKAFQGLLHQV